VTRHASSAESSSKAHLKSARRLALPADCSTSAKSLSAPRVSLRMSSSSESLLRSRSLRFLCLFQSVFTKLYPMSADRFQESGIAACERAIPVICSRELVQHPHAQGRTHMVDIETYFIPLRVGSQCQHRYVFTCTRKALRYSMKFVHICC